MFGSFGNLPILNAITVQQSHYYPVAEADVALGIPSLQLVSRKLEDLEIDLRFYGPDAALKAERWKAAGKLRNPEILIVGGKPLGRWLIVAIVQDITRAVNNQVLAIRLRVTLKEEGAFLWAGNYSPYEPPPNVRKTAEAGISGLSKAALNWLGV